MFKLRITSITAQRDMKALVKFLLSLPGLDSDIVAMGLKVLPFEILHVEQEAQAREIQDAIEKFGAVCEVEDTNAVAQKSEIKKAPAPKKKEKKSQKWFYATVATLVIGTVAFGLSVDYSTASQEKYNPQKNKPPPAPPREVSASQAAAPKQPAAEAKSDKKSEKKNEAKAADSAAPAPAAVAVSAFADKSSEDLKKDLIKNPNNPDAWKALSENLEQAGDTAAARRAQASYEKAIRNQKLLSGLAKSFGNNVRVEITEDAVYYRTSRDFKSEDEFYFEASKLRDSLSARFKGKKLIIENYASNEKVQRVELDP